MWLSLCVKPHGFNGFKGFNDFSGWGKTISAQPPPLPLPTFTQGSNDVGSCAKSEQQSTPRRAQVGGAGVAPPAARATLRKFGGMLRPQHQESAAATPTSCCCRCCARALRCASARARRRRWPMLARTTPLRPRWRSPPRARAGARSTRAQRRRLARRRRPRGGPRGPPPPALPARPRGDLGRRCASTPARRPREVATRASPSSKSRIRKLSALLRHGGLRAA